MNRILLLLIFATSSISAQNVVFPDAYFKTLLVYSSPTFPIAKNLAGEFFSIDANGDSQIQFSEAAQVSELDFMADDIGSLVGIQSFINLRRIDASNNSVITSLNVSGLTFLEELVVDLNPQLVSINISGCTSLKFLRSYSTKLGLLDLTDNINLEEIYVNENPFLLDLDVSHLPNLEKLECGGGLTTIDVAGLANLKILRCNNSPIASIDLSGLSSIEELSVSYNPNLNTVDVSQLLSLKSLGINNGVINAIEVGNLTNLIYLTAGHNSEISNIDVSGLTNLITLNFGNSSVTSVNAAGCQALQTVNAMFAQLTEINLLGCASLHDLDVRFNSLTSVDVSDSPNLNFLKISENPINSLNLKGRNIYYPNTAPVIDLSAGQNLQYICSDASRISYYQDWALTNGFVNCEVNSYCSFTPGGIFYTISGASRHDLNSNGCDLDDTVFSNLSYTISNGASVGSILANATGDYSITVQAGTHTITPVFENPSYFTANPATISVTFPGEDVIQNFCITANGVHNDLEIVIIPISPAVPGFSSTYRLWYKNKGNSISSGDIEFTYDSQMASFLSSSVAPQSNLPGTISFDYSNLSPSESRFVDIELQIETSVALDAIFQMQALVNPQLEDETPNDNTFTLQQIVIGSFDPNDKTCLEGNNLHPDDVGKFVHYLIRFENTGTYFAQNIVVKDIIDTNKFDMSSLQLGNASHPCYARINGNEVEFIFENIQLPFPPSEQRHGFIMFKIKTLPTLALADTFSNEASIYFDYNSPIVTDPAVTTISTLSNNNYTLADQMVLYPNPTSNLLFIQTSNNIDKIEIYDAVGRKVLSSAEYSAGIDISQLTIGNYILKVGSNGETAVKRFQKL